MMNIQAGMLVKTKLRLAKDGADKDHCRELYKTHLIEEVGTNSTTPDDVIDILGTTDTMASVAAQLLCFPNTFIIKKQAIAIEHGKEIRIGQLLSLIVGLASQRKVRFIETPEGGGMFKQLKDVGFQYTVATNGSDQKVARFEI